MKYAYHTNGMINGTVWGANHPHYSVIRAPQCHLSLHFVWYAHLIFYSVG